MNWLAEHLGIKPAHVEEDDEAPIVEHHKPAKKAAPKNMPPNGPPAERAYNWRNRHGLREVGELRP